MRTKKIFYSLLMLAIIVIFSAPAVSHAQNTGNPKTMPNMNMDTKTTPVSNTGGEETISGEVVDLSCYLADGDKGRGPDHKNCAVACAKGGSALCIITKNGDVYFPVVGMGKNNSQQLVSFAGDNVEVTGTVYKQSGLNGIKITDIKKTD